jgi:hypothetical protein
VSSAIERSGRPRRLAPTNTFTAFEEAEVAQSVPDRFSKQVRAHAGRVAVRTRTGSVTDAELDVVSDRVAATVFAAETGRVFRTVRSVSLGGDALYRSDVETCRRYFPHALAGVGLGSTETGAIARQWLDRDTPIPGHVVPVGYAAPDKEVVLLAPDGREVPTGESGEIAVRSRYLSPGYWRRPDLTAERFRVDGDGGERRLYRTGDQVRIRGFRVEVGEVEGALLSVPGVRDAAVVARDDPAGERRLVAYVVSADRPGPTASRLRQALADVLPEHMVPAAFVTMESLPRTAALKVDRLALPDPGRERPRLDTPMVAPRTPIERTLAGVWADALGLDAVGVHDRFLDLGGHSLVALRIASRVLDIFGVSLSERGAFASPTVETMAIRILQRLVQASGPSLREGFVSDLPADRQGGRGIGGPHE